MRNRRLTNRARAVICGVASAVLIVATLSADPAGVAGATLRPGELSSSLEANSEPQIWSFQPAVGELTPTGRMMLIDFTHPMRPDAVRVDIEPATRFWWHWSSPQQLVIQAQHNWLPLTSYHVT